MFTVTEGYARLNTSHFFTGVGWGGVGWGGGAPSLYTLILSVYTLLFIQHNTIYMEAML